MADRPLFWLILLLLPIPLAAQRPPVITKGCSTAPIAPPKTPLSDSDYVELTRTPCYGTCPSYTVRIAANGDVDWVGRNFVQTLGHAPAKIPAAAARQLIERFRTPEFWSLCDEYSAMVTDNPTYITTASIGGVSKKLSNYAHTAPAPVTSLEKAIDLTADTHRWRHREPKQERFEDGMDDCYLPKPGVTPLMCPPRRGSPGDSATPKPNINAADASGWTALMYAAGRGDDETFDRLLAAGADPKAKSAFGQTVLMAAVQGLSQHPLNRLAALRADVNAVDADGRTALMIAMSRYWITKPIDWLLAHGAKIDIKDKAGKTALDYLEGVYIERHADPPTYQRFKQQLTKH